MATVAHSILDYIAKRGSEDRVIDLATVFSGTGMTFSVESSDPSIAAVTIEDGKLVIDYTDALGYTDLKITATDASGQSVTDNVRVRVAGENAYTIAVLPDTQDYTNAADIGTFKGMTQWLVDNKDSLNIQFVTHVGDITAENGTDHWAYAKEALSILDGKIPYGLTLGNHDGVSGSYSTSRINDYFSVGDLKNANGENFGGTYDQEATLANNTYSTFTAPDGTKWLVLNLEFGAREDVVRWAGEVIEANLDHRVILTTHSYMTWAGRHDATGAPLYDEGTGYDYGLGNSNEGATDGETMYRELVQKYPNVTFTFSGHIFGDAAETLVSYDQFGNPVYQMMVNYQNGVAGEITSDAGQGSGSAGGNGAIRLVTIDPDNGAVYTSTYFAKLDDYMDSERGDGALDRDGLTGPYRGHEETITGVDLGTPEVPAIAKAGNDQFVTAEAGQEQASVTLDGDWTLNPKGDTGLSYVWTDRDGHVVATGATPTLSLGAGQHLFTLTVTDSAGRVSTDDVRIVVANGNTLLVDSFNDGDTEGWGAPGQVAGVSTGTPAEYGIAALPGAEPPAPVTDDYAFVPKANASQGLKIVPGFTLEQGATTLGSYSVVFDLYVPSSGAGTYTGLLQIDGGASNADAEMFLRKSGSVTGIGTLQNYQGNFTFDAWHRVAVTFTSNTDGSVTIAKYIDGAVAGSQTVSASDAARYQLDPVKGLTLLADDDGETSNAYVSSALVTDHVFTAAEVAALGGAKAGGIVSEAPSANSVQFDFEAGGAAPTIGQGTLTVEGGQAVTYDSQQDFAIPALPVPATGGAPAALDVTFIPKLSPSQALTLTSATDLPIGVYMVSSYTMAFDILVPASGVTSYVGLFQTDTGNTSDGDFFIRNNNNGTGGIGIGGNYPGAFKFDQWQRVVVKIETASDGSAVMSKYIDGVKVGTQGVDPGRYTIDLAKGVLLFTDEDGETADLYVSSFLFTDKLFSDAEIAALGGVRAGGIVDAQPTPYSVQIDFSKPGMEDEWGNSSVVAGQVGTSVGGFLVKGTVNSRDAVAEGQDALEGRVYEQSDGADKMLIWSGAESQNWSNYEFEATLKSTDNDGIGVVFYYKDAGNYYKVVLEAETNTRSLVKVRNGVETLLASEHGGTPWSRDFQLKVVAVDGRISAFLDGVSLFGEVADAAPLSGGTVGFYSDAQRSSQFDNVTVNKVTLTAHAGDDLRPVDADGDGRVTVDLDAGASYGLGTIVAYVWTDAEGHVVAQGEHAQVTLDAVKQVLTLTVTDASGKTATDKVTVDAVSQARVLLSEGFGGSGFSGWTIVDEGEFGGVGADGKSSQWQMRDGALVQLSDLKSRQLEWNGASNSDPWKTGWSPLGDGVNVLRKGTYALYNDAAAKEWTNYAVEATIQSPDNGALGLLFYYQDANNYYKLELDANGDYDRNPGNGAGSLFQLIQVKDGVEKYLNQFPAKYTPGEAFNLRVEVKDGKIQAYVDGLPLFAYAIEDRAQTKGTVGLFSWDSAGVSFDDILVYDLSSESALPPGGGEIVGTAGDDMLAGTAGDDAIQAGLGDDTVSGGAGNDAIDGGEGDDSLNGGEGDDLLKGRAGDDDLIGGAGNDGLAGGEGDDLLDGGAGIDTADYSDDMAGVTVDLSAGEASGDEVGEDELVGIENVVGGSGADVLIGDDEANRLVGGLGDDLLKGGAGNDVLDGGAGHDVIEGGAGDDLVLAGLGDDLIDGGEGYDTLDLSAATGAVTVDFGAGRVSGQGIGADRFTGIEKLLFGAGDDIVTGGNGDDAFDGGAGNDTLKGGAGDDTIAGGAGDDAIDGGSGDDVLEGGLGSDAIKAGSGDDRVEAGEGDDVIDAGSGDDAILAGAGNDTVDGGSGDDRIVGGAGDDRLSGGSGHDVFVFAAGFGKDTVADFRTTGSSSDILEFSVDVFADFEAAMEAADQVGADTVFTVDAQTSLTLKGVQLSTLQNDDFRFV